MDFHPKRCGGTKGGIVTKTYCIRVKPLADSAEAVHTIECLDDATVLGECLRLLAGGRSAEAWEDDRLVCRLAGARASVRQRR
jgi:hypothetical protein